MIIDNDLLLSEKQDISATAASTNVVNAGKGDPGVSPLELVALVTTAGSGTGSVVVALETCDTATGTFSTLVESPSLEAADLTARARILAVRVPVGAKQYLRLNYTVTGTLSVSVSAFLVLDSPAGM